VPPAVTVVIATHNRPQGLIRALRSVLRQTVPWQAIVVGDACDPATGQAIAALADPRIRYINLASRTGEQSLPNSVGLALADTPFLALLNHDDIWFPDHLAQARAALDRTGADLWTGQAVEIAPARGRGVLPFRVGHRTRPGRRLIDALTQGYLLFEPASSWVMRAGAFARVGPFTPAAHLHRTPVEDWILRAARAGLVQADGAQVTVLKENRLRPAGQTTEYAADNTPAAVLTALFRLRPAVPVLALIRRWLDAQVTGHAGTVPPGGPTWGHDLPDGLPAALTAAFAALGPGSAERFLATGTDDFSAALDAKGVARGWRLRRSLRRRTGEALPEPPDLATLIAAARQELTR
jgi:glycosyltransferase involved in cell wall biosynthesis